MSSRLQAMEVYCPECGAAINEACLLARVGRTGRVFRRACHRERHQLYQRSRGPISRTRIVRQNAELIHGEQKETRESQPTGAW